MLYVPYATFDQYSVFSSVTLPSAFVLSCATTLTAYGANGSRVSAMCDITGLPEPLRTTVRGSRLTPDVRPPAVVNCTCWMVYGTILAATSSGVERSDTLLT
jgi:hypothetical protein